LNSEVWRRTLVVDGVAQKEEANNSCDDGLSRSVLSSEQTAFQTSSLCGSVALGELGVEFNERAKTLARAASLYQFPIKSQIFQTRDSGKYTNLSEKYPISYMLLEGNRLGVRTTSLGVAIFGGTSPPSERRTREACMTSSWD
jgi:hypothetical protein